MKRDPHVVQHAYSKIEFKAADPAEAGKPRTFSGIATTPTIDLSGDIVESQGAQFTLPIPLLLAHDPEQPIGWVTDAKVSKNGIVISGTVADVPNDGPLKTRLADAWQALTAGLIGGLSIGFLPVESVQIEGTWSYRYTAWKWLELSAVVIPCNTDAHITTIKDIKAADAESLRKHQPKSLTVQTSRRVFLNDPPGATGSNSVAARGKSTPQQPEGSIMTVKLKEQISAFEAKRTTALARQSELMEKAAEAGATLDEAGEQEFDQLETEIKQVNAHIERLKKMAATDRASATEIDPKAGATEGGGAQLRGGARQLSVHDRLPKGARFTRYVMALAASKGNVTQAEQIAKQHFKDTPEIAEVLAMNSAFPGQHIKTAVNPGTTTDGVWAGPLQYYQNMASEFIELLRPATILGKLDKLRRMPFNVRVGAQTSGSTVGWTGEGNPKPVSSLGFQEVRLDHAKIAGIVVITQELARFSEPAAQELVSNDLRDAISAFMDAQFIDPSVAAVAGVSPASVTNGLTPVVSGSNTGGTTSIATIDADAAAALGKFIAAEIDPTTAVWIMKPTTALTLSMKRTANGEQAYPGLTMLGGTWQGLPVIVSNSVPGSVSGGTIIALVAQSQIFYADDGDVVVDVSQEASLQMVTNPTTGAASLTSLWQQNLIGVRCERWVNWKPRRSTAITYIDQVMYA